MATRQEIEAILAKRKASEGGGETTPPVKTEAPKQTQKLSIADEMKRRGASAPAKSEAPSATPQRKSIRDEMRSRRELVAEQTSNINATSEMLNIPVTSVESGHKDFKAALKANTPEAPTIKGAFGELGGAFADAAKNIPSSGGRMLADIASVFTSPVQTGKGLYGLASGLVQKMIPGEQDNEAIVDAVVASYKERYGSTEQVAETFKKDPVGLISDVAGILMAGGGALKGAGVAAKAAKLTKTASNLQKAGTAAKTVGQAVDPLAILNKPKILLSKPLQASAEATWEKVLRPTTKKAKEMTQGFIERLAKEKKVFWSKEAMAKSFNERVSTAGDAIGDFLDEVGIDGSSQTADIVANIEKVMNDTFVKLDVKPTKKKKGSGQEVVVSSPDGSTTTFTAKTPQKAKELVITNEAKYAMGQKMIKKIKEFGDTIPNEKLLEFKRNWGKDVAKVNGFIDAAMNADLTDFKRAGVKGMIQELSKASPDLAKLNKDFAYLKDVADVVKETVKRQTGQSGGFTKKLGTAIALVTGDNVSQRVGGAVALNLLFSLTESTGWKTLGAAAKAKLAELLATGSKTQITNHIRQISRDISEIEEKEERNK